MNPRGGSVSKPTGETALQGGIIRGLTAVGVWCFRVPAGSIRHGSRYIQMCPKGTPDVWTELGWLEVKVPGGKRSIDQVAWHERAERASIRVATVSSVAEAVAVVLAWRREAAA
jgi:hypothetical protein